MKRFYPIVGLCLLATLVMGATIMWYSQQTAGTAIGDTYVVALERPSGPHRYEYFTMLSLRAYTGTNTVLVSSNVYATNIVTTNLYTSNLFATNIYTSNAYVTNLYSSNAYITNLTVNNLYALTSAVDNLTVTNPITNLSLTANTIVKADANQALASVANAAGRLTNNGSGTFGWDNSASGVSDSTVLNMINTNAVWTNDGENIILTGPNFAPLNNTGIISVYDSNTNWFNTNNYTLKLRTVDTTTIAGKYPTSLYIDCRLSTRFSSSPAIYDGVGVFAVSAFTGGGGLEDGQAIALFGRSAHTTTNIQYGVVGYTEDVNSGYSVAVAGTAVTYDGNHTNVAGYFEVDSNGGIEPIYENSVLLLDARGQNIPLIIGRTNNGTRVFSLSKDGVAIANGYQDNSLTPGAIVAVGTAGRLINTNVQTLINNTTFTNLYATNITVYNDITVFSNATIKTLNVQNVYVTNGSVFKEHTWLGPTNQLYVGSTNQYIYTAYTPCAVTNLVALISGFANSALLRITNAAATNITFTVHSPIQIPYGEATRTYTITNYTTWAGSFMSDAHGMIYVPRGFWSP